MIISRQFSIKEKVREFKENPKETIRKTLHKGVDHVVDNPIDTATYVAGDLVLPGMIYKKMKPKVKSKAGKIALASTMGLWASSPVGPTTAAISYKNKLKKKRAASKNNESC